MKMAVLCCTSMQLLLVALAALAGICLGGSDGPRGVALPFVFDPKATCEPPCKHAGICIRNNTCFCSRGYEGETCQYGDVSSYLLCSGFYVKMVECAFDLENADALQDLEENTVTKKPWKHQSIRSSGLVLLPRLSVKHDFCPSPSDDDNSHDSTRIHGVIKLRLCF
ncbi:hypothetical protein DPX16_8266 [Anabarilius grahami]|uniref:EGF-like domain-containing protein n=1 Tax=Anabarilius grahami TaxID=495550 RepID=A0A3N0YG60_ANAGA|nr:hypothetical protein DPX16_8266 [Anabarilius grahami]